MNATSIRLELLFVFLFRPRITNFFPHLQRSANCSLHSVMNSTQVLRIFLILASFGFFVWGCSVILHFYSIDTWEALGARSRLLCIVLSQDTQENAIKRRAAQETWGRRCDQFIVVLNGTRLNLDRRLGRITVPIGAESREKLWHKIVKMFSLVYAEYGLYDFDWFMKADDDTYVIVENLRLFLGDYSPEEPTYFGHKFKPFVSQGYMSGGE